MPAPHLPKEAGEVSSPRVENREQPVGDETIHFAPVDKPRVSVIISGWRSAPFLIDCLRSISTRMHSVPYEVIVSLNEPTASLVQTLERDVAGIRVLTTAVNVGFAGACNRGAAEASGDLLVLLNDDATVLDGWLEALVDAAVHHDQAGAVGSRVLLDDGTVQEEGAVVWADGATTLIGYQGPADSSPDPRLRRMDYCSAVSLLVKRDTWDSVGGLDLGYFPAYFEDVDLCMKIQAGGQSILYEPRSVVVHRESSSTTRSYRTFLAERNKRRFAARWSSALALFEAPEPESPEAIARAAKLGESRPLPLPGPLPMADDPPGPVEVTDADYLRRQLGIQVAYASALEDTVTSVEAARDASETVVAELQAELHRMHHEAANLQAEVENLQAHDRAMRAELFVFLNRGRYKFIDRTYEIAMSVPGFAKALRWADARHRPRADTNPPD
jgi:GT2 family glycosyltransferase